MSTTISVSDEVADELYELKGRGDSYNDVVKRLLARPESGEAGEAGGETAETPVSADRHTRGAQSPASDPQGNGGETSEDEPLQGDGGADRVEDSGDPALPDIVDTVAGEVLPGSGQKLEARREALHAVVRYLIRERTASRSDFQEDVYPGNEARYTTGDDPAYSWWKNAMCDGLGAIAERSDAIEKADTAGDWSYVRDGDEAVRDDLE